MTIRPLILASFLLPLGACTEAEPDAQGHFEGVEVMVSAEVAGRLDRFDVVEGARLAEGAKVGQIDATMAMLQRDELLAQRGATAQRADQALAQAGAVEAQLLTAERELARIRRLYAAEAATAQQLERAEGEVRVLGEQLNAAGSAVRVVRDEGTGADARLAQLEEQIERSQIVNPTEGTVLSSFAEVGEFVQPGQPLYSIANLGTLTLRVYVTEPQLSGLRLDDPVTVLIDAPDGDQTTLHGQISSIAAEAEFTPTPIQTRDERATHVYAVRIRVPNPDGAAKIGMPADVVFTDERP